MNKHVLTGLASAMMSMGMSQGVAHAYSSYWNRSYARQFHKEDNTQGRSLTNKHSAGLLAERQTHSRLPASQTLTIKHLQQRPTVVGDLVLHNNTHASGKLHLPKNYREPSSAQLGLDRSAPVNELIVIDQAVPDKHLFYQQLKPGVDIVEINTQQDGLQQLLNAMQQYRGLAALHIVSHAKPGSLQLGSSHITAENLQHRVEVFSQINKTLRTGGDILLYGCELAADKAGEALLDIVKNRTHADIAASNNVTGSDKHGGDWTLEIQKGEIQTQQPFSALALKDFSSVLLDRTLTMTGFVQDVYAEPNSYTFNTSYTVQLSVDDGDPDNNSMICLSGGTNGCYVGSAASTGDQKFYIEFTSGHQFDVTGFTLFTGYPVGYTISSDKGDSHTFTGANANYVPITLNWTGIRKLTFSRQNGTDLESLGIFNIALTNITMPNAAPVISNLNGDSFTYTEGNGQQLLDQGTALTVTDGDSTDFDTGNLTVTITSGEDAAEDTLSVSTAGTVSLAGTTAGSNVSVSGTVVGTLANNIAAGNDLVVNLNANATPATTQTLMRAVHYENTDINNPTAGARNVRFTVNDGDGGTSTNHDVTVTVQASNDAPAISNLNGDSFTYTEGDGQQILDQGTGLLLSDVDSSDFNGGNLTVTITSGEDAAEDTLSVSTAGTVSLAGTTAGSNVSVSGTVVGTLANNIAAGNDLVVNLNADATPARVQTLARAAHYENTDISDPTAGARVVRLTVNDGDGGTSTNSDVTVTVAAADSDGDLTAAAGVSEPVALSYSIDSTAEAVDLFDFTLSDGGGGDGLAMTVSTIVLHVAGTASDTDRAKVTWRLNGSDVSNVVGSYNAGNDTLTFTGLNISIADGSSEIYTVNGYYNNNSGLTHGNTIILSVDGDTDLTLTAPSTSLASTSLVSNGSGTVISDDVPATVQSVSVPANNTYTAAANLDFVVNFNESITVNTSTGTARLPLTIGAASRFAGYISGSGSSSLTFRYTVQVGDEDVDGITLGTALDPNMGTLRDGAGNDVTNTLNSVGNLAAVLVDAVAPTVAEVTPVTTPNNDATPTVTVSVSEAGTLAVGGSCGSPNEGAVSSGNSSITLTQADNSTSLTSGNFTDCTATVTDAAGNTSNVLALTAFVVDVTPPVVNTNAGQSLNEGDTDIVVGNTELTTSDNLSTAANTTYTLVSVPVNGTLQRSGATLTVGATFTQADIDNTLITYDHDGGDTLTDSFTFTVTDELGNTNNNGGADFSFLFGITAVNDAPVATADISVTNEDNAVTVDVLANDSDSDGSLNPASVTVTSNAANGTTSVNTGTGAITYTPAANFNGSDTFSYTVEDNNMLVSQVTTVSITVNAQNDAPVAVADVVATLAETLVSIDVANNDSDIDSGDAVDPATVVVVSAATNGSAVFNAATGRIDYTPAAGFSGTDSFTYTINDGAGATSNAATVTVNVTNPNVLPVAADDSATTAEDTAVAISVLSNDSDSDGSLVVNSVTIQSHPASGSVNVDTVSGVVTYTPTADSFGSDSFTYTVQDDDGGTSNVATVSITMTPVNDAPVANNDTATLMEDNTFTINVLGNDSDVDGTLVNTSVTVVSAPTSGTAVVNAGAGTIAYTPNENFSGGDSFTYQVNDDLGVASNVATVTLTVDAVNDAPLANNDSVVAVVNQPLVINPLSNDSDIDGLLNVAAITVQTAPSHGSLVNNNDGTLTYTATSGAGGSDSLTYSVQDLEGASSNVATVAIVIRAGMVPTITGDPTTQIDVGDNYSFTPTVQADTNANLVFEISNAPSWASFDTDTGTLSGAPTDSDVGTTHDIVIRVNDGLTTVALAAFDLSVELVIDTDNDGLPDEFEQANGLNPNEDDAGGDLDGDGVLNIDEYINQTNPQLDDYAPVINLETHVVIDASGLLTPMPTDLASAVDGLDGPVQVTHDITSSLLAPGRYTIQWSATDSAGNTGTETQTLDVRPLANWQVDQQATEGSSIAVTLHLNGEAPEYPVVANYSVSGTANNPDDHDATSGTLIITSGQQASQTVIIAADTIDENDETLIFTLDTVTQAAIGVQSQHTVTISESNHAPSVVMTASLSANLLDTSVVFARDGGPVTVTAVVQDIDSNDSHSLQWQDVDGLGGTVSGHYYSFDPSGLSAGVYQLQVEATDNASNPLSGSNVLALTIVDTLTALSASEDADGDGVDDASEGFADIDQDGVPEYLDNNDQSNLLAMYPAGNPLVAGAWFVEAQPGLSLQLHTIGAKSQRFSPLVGLHETQGNVTGSEPYYYRNGLFEFVITQLSEPGASAMVVLPQLEPIPDGATYRKFLNNQWHAFVENADNSVSSAPGELGRCPPVGSADYRPGLNSGDYCVQLLLEDGGRNDADGQANGVIVDPGGVAIQAPAGMRRSGGGGGSGDALLLLLILLNAANWQRLPVLRQIGRR